MSTALSVTARGGSRRDSWRPRRAEELADFIRAGSARGPQCFGSYFDEHGGLCLRGPSPAYPWNVIPDHLERLFRGLDEMTKMCPRSREKRLPLASMIVHPNDDHRLTREQIAQWLSDDSVA